MPFFALAISQKAQSHLSSEIGESSMTVPTLTENCLFSSHSEHSQILRLFKKRTSLDSQRGQTTPAGQRSDTMKLSALSPVEKYRIAACKVWGNCIEVVFIHPYTAESSILLPLKRWAIFIQS